jgi:glycosyltransferase involved in cell wall biosynthesis
MRILLINEHRFDSSPDGAVWTRTIFPYSFWTRYLDVFERVVVVARVNPAERVKPDWVRADGVRVSFIPVQHYIGPAQYLLRARRVRCQIRQAVQSQDAVIMRVPSTLATALEGPLKSLKRPFGLEVVGDPHEVFGPGVFRHPLRPAFRFWFTRQLQRQCASACAVHYVTRSYLQKKYPASPGVYTNSFSDVQLDQDSFVSSPREYKVLSSPFRLVTVGTLEQTYKGTDILLQSIAINKSKGILFQLTVVGDGRYRSQLEILTMKLGLDKQVRFLGSLPQGEAIRDELDKADAFILPSRIEGLPRAMIEAMARGLPCIGTDVGGIPELLPKEDLVPSGSCESLAAKLAEIFRGDARLAAMSERNLRRAADYDEKSNRSKRIAFYQYVRVRTREWIDDNSAHHRGIMGS